jgi:hypothetical protein
MEDSAAGVRGRGMDREEGGCSPPAVGSHQIVDGRSGLIRRSRGPLERAEGRQQRRNGTGQGNKGFHTGDGVRGSPPCRSILAGQCSPDLSESDVNEQKDDILG